MAQHLDDVMDFSRPVSETADPIPAVVRLEEGDKGWDLCWEWEKKGERVPNARPDDRRLLREFLDLPLTFDSSGVQAREVTHDEKEQKDFARRVKMFARHFGVLLLCKHGRPYVQCRLPYSKGLGETICEPTKREPLSTWLSYARQARAIARLAAELRLGRRGASADWGLLGLEERAALKADLKDLPPVLCLKLSDWLRQGQVLLQVVWRGRGPVVALDGTGVLASVARQLTFSFLGADGFVVCRSCGEPTVPTRRPKPDQRSWCKPCRDAGASKRAAKRDARARQRAKEKSGQPALGRSPA